MEHIQNFKDENDEERKKSHAENESTDQDADAYWQIFQDLFSDDSEDDTEIKKKDDTHTDKVENFKLSTKSSDENEEVEEYQEHFVGEIMEGDEESHTLVEEEEEEEEEESPRTRFKNERSNISLKAPKLSRNIPDSLDEVIKKNNLNVPNEGVGKVGCGGRGVRGGQNRGRGGRGMARGGPSGQVAGPRFPQGGINRFPQGAINRFPQGAVNRFQGPMPPRGFQAQAWNGPPGMMGPRSMVRFCPNQQHGPRQMQMMQGQIQGPAVGIMSFAGPMASPRGPQQPLLHLSTRPRVPFFPGPRMDQTGVTPVSVSQTVKTATPLGKVITPGAAQTATPPKQQQQQQQQQHQKLKRPILNNATDITASSKQVKLQLPPNKHPNSILNQMYMGSKWLKFKESEFGAGTSITYECTVEVEGQTFKGQGKAKKVVKAKAAEAALLAIMENWRKGKLPLPGAPQNVIDELMKSPEIQQQLKSTTTTTTTTTPTPTAMAAKTSVGPQKEAQTSQQSGRKPQSVTPKQVNNQQKQGPIVKLGSALKRTSTEMQGAIAAAGEGSPTKQPRLKPPPTSTTPKTATIKPGAGGLPVISKNVNPNLTTIKTVELLQSKSTIKKQRMVGEKRKRYLQKRQYKANHRKKFRRARCHNCFLKDCLSIQDQQYDCNVRLVCHICFNHITPDSKFSCREKCLQEKKTFSQGMCSLHKIKFVFGNICLLCNPYIKVCSVRLMGNNCDYGEHINILYECTKDGVLCDMFGISTGDFDFNRYKNILDSESDNTLSGAGHDVIRDENNTLFFGPHNLIRKIHNIDVECIFYITPPGPGEIHSICTYLRDKQEILNHLILSSGFINETMNYKLYMNAFSKYAKTSDDNVLQYGGIHHQTHTKSLTAYSGDLKGPFLNSLIEELSELQATQAEHMTGSNWTYLGPAQISLTLSA